MKSIKPGRGPSFVSGIVCIFMALFGVIWTVVAAGAGGGVFALFGVVFIAIAIVEAVYSFKNATSENRYSAFDITDDAEEPDPLNQRFGNRTTDKSADSAAGGSSVYCPYCGAKAEGDYAFCNKCGKKLP